MTNESLPQIEVRIIVHYYDALALLLIRMDAEKVCGICCSTFTDVKRSPVTCLFCNNDACRQCWEAYLISNAQEPNCMHCKTPWNREFIDKTFSTSFRNGPLKAKRECHLLQREEALLPATQWYARHEKRHQRLLSLRNDLGKRIMDLESQVIRHTRESIDLPLDLRTAYQKVITERSILTIRIRSVVQLIREGPIGNEEAQARSPRRTFIRRCPRDDCKGYLSTQYKCGLCKGKVCPKCVEPLSDDDDSHVCNPDTVATIQTLVKDTKPCPKCAVLIYKIDGCDQMWCIECKTAFSWNTGKIEKGHVHNPHWYEWQRRMNNGIIPREPGDAPGGLCGHVHLLPGFDQFMFARHYDVAPQLVNLHRSIVHMVHVILPRLTRPEFTEETNRDLRIKYLLGSIDQKTWKKILYQREKKREKELAIRQALEMYINVSGDVLWKLTEVFEENDEMGALDQLNQLRKYTNECLSNIHKRFNSNRIMIIDTQFILYPL